MFESGIARFAARWIFLPAAFLSLTACEQSSEIPAAIGPVPLTYVGSESCRTCHEDQYAAWTDSHHALAMQHATPATVLGDFSGVDVAYFDTVSTFFTRDDTHYVRTANADGELQEFPISYTFGVTPLQQYLIEFPGGRLQSLAIAWDTRGEEEGGQRWFHLYPDEYIGHDDPLHWTGRDQNWNYMCAECHSTDLQKNYDAISDSFATTWNEINVGCEGCHGPGSRHATQAEAGESSGLMGLVVDLDDAGRAVWQMNPETGVAARSELRMRPPVQPEACGRCHSRRALATADYEFGKSLLDTHSPVMLDEGAYFADGQILDEVYVYGSFLQSRMYQAGVTCSDCHDPHAAKLRSAGSPSDICATCHLPSRFDATEHHRHQPGEVACVDCHMASRDYMVVDGRRDHSFRIPRPDLTIATGSPNACNQCHAGEDASWAQAAIFDWYGDTQAGHYGFAIHAGRIGSADATRLLLEAIANPDYPGIARGTALTLLRAPYSNETATAIRRELGSGDPFVRIGALRALSGMQPELQADMAAPLLADPVRTVRIEAARVVSGVRSVLQAGYGRLFAEAEQELIESMQAIAERPEAHINLGNTYTEAGDAQRAETEFRIALRIDPLAVGPRVNLADLYRRTAREADAEALLREGIELDADEASYHHSLGLLLVRGDRRDAGLEELESAAALQPDNPRYVYVYGVALNSLGQADEAIAMLSDASRRFPADFDVHWALATMLRDQGRSEEAKAVAEQLAARYPGVQPVENLLQSLSVQ